MQNYFRELRFRSKSQRGFILMGTILMIGLLSGVVFMSMDSTAMTVKNSALSDSHITATQLADMAVQDAAYQLNEKPLTGLPKTPGAARSGAANGGTWKWYMEPVVNGPEGSTTTIHASGTGRDGSRFIDVTAKSVQVGGFIAEDGKDLAYELSPRAAFAHVALGNEVVIQNGSGVGTNEKFVSGLIGVTGGKLDLSPYVGTAPKLDVQYGLYGGPASALNTTKTLTTKAPIGLALDANIIPENLSLCGDSGDNWVASRNGGILVANGNVGCYESMTFDVPTSIKGSGAYTAFVRGNVTFTNGVTAAATTGLNIYAGGNVTFNTEAGATLGIDLPNVFIYAPSGTCQTQPFRSVTKKFELSGSLACKSVRVAGQLTHAAPIAPWGNDTYTNNVWFMSDYRQPSGSRG